MRVFFSFLIIYILPAQNIPDIQDDFLQIRFGCIEDSFGDCCEAPFEVWYDNDNDGLGDPDIPALACLDYAGWVTNDSDPNDNCFSNEFDCADNCDGSWVEDQFGMCCSELQTFWQDLDGDGLGNPNISMLACEEPDGWSLFPVDLMDNCFSNIKDCLGICDGTAYYDACAVCDDNPLNDDTACVGCMDDEAINYNPDALIDSDNCIYSSDHIWHVSVVGSDETGSGTVENPFETINHTIAVAVESDTILVHTGTYYENINYAGKNILICSMFYFTADTSFISLTQINGSQIASVVTFESGEDSTAILAGFTITNGWGDFVSSAFRGGGITVRNNANPYLTNLVITDNSAFRGGGIKVNNSSPTITNSIISYNTAYGDTYSHGGGIHAYSSNIIVTNVDIIGNTAGYNSGGLYQNTGDPIFTNVNVFGNYALNAAGGVGFSSSGGRLVNCIISNNTTQNFAAGVLFWLEGNTDLDHVLIVGNISASRAAIHSKNSSPKLINVTISDNSSTNNNNIGLENSPNLIFLNSIIWDDLSISVLEEMRIEYSDVMGLIGSGTNISADPLFVDPITMDYSLDINSPCIDSGVSNFESDIISYYINQDEYFGYNPDMGAFESEYSNCLPGDVNNDDTIDILDVIILVEHILNGNDLTDIEQWVYDVNQDGIIDILDIVMLIGLIFGS